MADDHHRLAADLRAMRGNPDAAEHVYVACSDDLLAYLLRRASPDEAADALSMTFMDVRSGRAVLGRSDQAYPKAWLMSIARRRLSDLRRNRATESGAWLRAFGMRELSDDEYAALEARVGALKLAPELERALGQLPPGEAEILRLVAEDGLSAAEASRVLGISAGVVLTRPDGHLKVGSRPQEGVPGGSSIEVPGRVSA